MPEIVTGMVTGRGRLGGSHRLAPCHGALAGRAVVLVEEVEDALVLGRLDRRLEAEEAPPHPLTIVA